MIGALGRVASRDDARTLKLADYVDPRDYPAPPPAVDWTGAQPYRWWRNNELGCCTIAALAHLAECHAARHGEDVGIDDQDIEAAYRAVSGWDGTPATDRGAQMIDALIYARRVGIGPWRVGAFVKVELDDPTEVRAAIALFGGIYVGADLPRRIQTQGATWTLPPIGDRTDDDAPRSLGGHAYAVTGYDRLWLRAMPWVTRTRISNAWSSLYNVEAWAIVADSWVSGARRAPSGLDLETLRRDLEAIGR